MTKSVFTFVLFLFFATALSAQDSDAMVSSITTFNNTVNADIASEKLFSHRITLNTESSKVKFWGKMNKYTENATCYFELKDGGIVLRKVIILADITDRQSYTDILFDAEGNPSMFFYTNNTKNPNAQNERYYYGARKLIFFSASRNTIDGAVSDTYDETNFETKHINDGLSNYAKAENYKKLFDALVKVQMSPY
ncbi:MAG TPA: hypothetical protein PK239_07050 [Chitinophagales bacterium]|nr:hypothetical protein [Chitinophagales bacterium]